MFEQPWRVLHQPQKKEYSLNYKCSFPVEWLGKEKEELAAVTGLESAGFCHKGGFLMTTGTLEDAEKACRISLETFQEEPVLVNFGGDSKAEDLLRRLPKMKQVKIVCIPFPEIPDLEENGIYAEVQMEKPEWKAFVKETVKSILKYKPEAVYVGDHLFEAYPVVHQLRRRHIPVLALLEKNGEKRVVRIPSGS